MKKTALAIIMAGLMLLAVIVMCSSASAGANIQGRVTFNGIGVKGARVEAVGGAQSAEAKTGLFGFYSMYLDLKHTPTNIRITAYTKFGDQTKIIENTYGGNYWISFHFGGIVNVPHSKELNKQKSSSSNLLRFLLLNIIMQTKNNNRLTENDVQDVTDNNPTNIGQHTIENKMPTANPTFNDYEDSSSFSDSRSSSSSTST